MQQWHSIDDVLNFAIGEEIAAAEFYTRLGAQSKAPGMREMFEGFAQEEQKHKVKLEAIKAGGLFKPSDQKVSDLKIADYMPDVAPVADMDYRSALVVAMKKEKAAFRLYSDLAASASDENIKATFLALAQEEARHKLHFEVEYDDLLTEN
jgi:rubrerythrin